MKILLVHPSFHFYGGAEIAIVKLVNYLTEKKNTVDILTLQITPQIRDDMNINKIIIVDSLVDMKMKLNNIALEYDVINFHNHPSELLLDIPYKSVWFCNEPPDEVLDGKELSKEEIDHVRKTITTVVVSDKKNAQRFQKVYGITPKIIPYGTDYEFWSNDEEDRRRWDNRGKFTIVHSAAIHRRKGQLETVKIFIELSKSIPNLKLYLAGMVMDGQYINEISKLARDAKVDPDSIIVTGMLTREELRSLYHSADVLLHPIGNQGGWLTPIDAMATGLPVVISKEANISDIIFQNNLGYVEKNIDGYVNRIYSIYKGDVGVPVEVTGCADKYVKTKLSWDNYCNKVMKELQRVCQK